MIRYQNCVVCSESVIRSQNYVVYNESVFAAKSVCSAMNLWFATEIELSAAS
jgi:hypothetical protein